MTILRATTQDLPRVRAFLDSARHSYCSVSDEDLRSLLSDGIALWGCDGAQAWGFAAVHREPPSDKLPPSAPTRAYWRALALARGRSPIADVPLLTSAVAAQLMQSQRSAQLIYYDSASWLVKPLQRAQMVLVDRVQFLRMSPLNRWLTTFAAWLPSDHPVRTSLPDSDARQRTPIAPSLHLRQLAHDDIDALSTMDARAFEPLWHIGRVGLLELSFGGRVCVADWDGRIVGYAALLPLVDGDALLGRLAVDPDFQGIGIGRRLLAESIAHAYSEGARAVVLNTQTSNQRSLAIYRSFGFRRTGELLPVLTRLIEPRI